MTFPEDIQRELVNFRPYWLVLLYAGPHRGQTEAEAAAIQERHLRHNFRLKREGVMAICGPVLDDASALRGICIYACASREEVERHAAADPAVIAGRLRAEILPWGGMAGSALPFSDKA